MLFTEFNLEDALQVRGEEKYEEGRETGLKAGADLFAALTTKLIQDSRTYDLLRAAQDKDFRDSLFQEYGITSDPEST